MNSFATATPLSVLRHYNRNDHTDNRSNVTTGDNDDAASGVTALINSSTMSVRERRSLFEPKSTLLSLSTAPTSQGHLYSGGYNTKLAQYVTAPKTPVTREKVDFFTDDDTSTIKDGLSKGNFGSESGNSENVEDPPRIPAPLTVRTIVRSSNITGNKENPRSPFRNIKPNFKPRLFSSESLDKSNRQDLRLQRQQVVDTSDEATSTSTAAWTDNVLDDNIQSYKTYYKEQEKKILILQSKYRRLTDTLVQLEEFRSNFANEAEALRSERERLSARLEYHESKIKNVQYELESATKQNSELKSNNKELSDNISQLLVQIRDCETNRDVLKEKLAVLEVNFLNVSEKLLQAERDIDLLMNDKKALEEENIRIKNDSDNQLEEQRILNMHEAESFRKELKLHETKLKDLEVLLEEKVQSERELRLQLSNLEAHHTNELSSVKSQYDQKIQNIRAEVTVEAQNSMYEEMKKMQAKLNEKNSEIAALKSDISSRMHELMLANSELQKLEYDSATLDGLYRDVEVLQQERMELSEQLHDRDIEIAELSAEILKLAIEKELCSQDAIKAQELKQELIAAQDIYDQSQARLNEVLEASLQLEAKIFRINLENEQTIERIRTDYDQNIASIQSQSQLAKEVFEQDIQELNTRYATLEDRFSEAKMHSDNEITSLILSKSNLLEANENLRCTIIEQNQRLEAFKVAERKSVIRYDTKISQLEEQIRQLEATKLDMENRLLSSSLESSTEIESMNHTISKLEIENEVSKISIEQYQNALQESRCQLNEEKAAYDSEVERLTEALLRRDNKVASLEKELKSLSECLGTSQENELEVSQLQNETNCLKQLNKDLENVVQEKEQSIEELRKTNSNLIRERDFANISVINNENKLVDKENQIAQLEALLQGSRDALAACESKASYLRNEIATISLEYKKMQEQSSKLQVRLLDKEDELKASVVKWKKAENEYLADKHIERTERECLEAKLEQLQSKLDSISLDRKCISRLEKENEELKDKVNRQTALLQKKLEKEKAERKVGCVRKTSLPTSAKEMECKSPSILSNSTRSTMLVNDGSCCDVDLDSLLAD